MVRCPQCATEHEEGLDACPSCGHFYENIRCRRCGEEFADNDACPACGLATRDIECAQHPDVKAEGRCVVCGLAVCRGCNASEGPVVLCQSHSDVTVIQGWAQIYSTTREFEALLLRDNLTSEGVDARIFSQKDNIFSVDLGELSIVRLLVPAWEFERASEIIRMHMNDAGEVTFACPSCGEAYEPGTERCSECGALLDSIS